VAPSHETARTMTFNLPNLDPSRVTAATARLNSGVAHIDKPLHRNISASRIRQALAHRGHVSIPKPRFVEGGRLELTMLPPHGPSNPSDPSTDPSDPTGTPSGDCTVDPATMTGPGCNVLRSDTADSPDAVDGLWGNVECASQSRSQFENSGGDPAPTISGAAQDNNSYRSLTALDGDDFFGERCELGRNTSRYGENRGKQTDGTFALYDEGDHQVTFLSQRYGDSFSTSVNAWQTVMQMKQAQPYDSTLGSGPMIELQIYGNRLRLQNDWHQAWTTEAPQKGVWVRYALDVVYSQDPDVGSVKVYADLNGDGDALDAGEQSPVIHMATLLTETAGPNGTSDGLAPGDPIPDHLRVGLYHNPSIACPPPAGCGIDLDNVEVAG
jgi:Polysaccharide lyase